MDSLLMLYTFLLVSSFVLQYLLFKTRDDHKKNRIVFIVNFILVFVLSLFAYSSLPSNYTIQKIVAVLWTVIAFVGLVFKYQEDKPVKIANTLLTIAMLGAIIQSIFV